jgi:hypothetical protein
MEAKDNRNRRLQERFFCGGAGAGGSAFQPWSLHVDESFSVEPARTVNAGNRDIMN